jgi:hypothetical protein
MCDIDDAPHRDNADHLSLVRDLGRDCYAELGRPSIDPVVLFIRRRSEVTPSCCAT